MRSNTRDILENLVNNIEENNDIKMAHVVNLKLAFTE